MDRLIRCITSNGAIMASAVDSTVLVATAQQVHNTSPVATAALGRLLTGASIMGAMLKKEDASLTLKINGGGPLGSVVAIADSHGNCRGWVEHPEVDLPLKPNGKLDVGAAVGQDGLLGVLRDFGSGQPYIGQVEIVSGEIAEDITNYYATSEQIPTVCALGVLVDKADHKLLLAGGMLVQVLPGATDADITQLEQNVAVLEPVTTMLAKGMTIEDMCRAVLQGFEMEILDEFPWPMPVIAARNAWRTRWRRSAQRRSAPWPWKTDLWRPSANTATAPIAFLKRNWINLRTVWRRNKGFCNCVLWENSRLAEAYSGMAASQKKLGKI